MSDPIQIIVFLILGVAAIFAFFKFQEKRKKVIENGIEVTGIVFESSKNAPLDYTNSTNFRSDHPMIRFVTKEGLWITEQADYGGSGFFYLSKIGYLVLIIGIASISVALWFAYKYLTSEI
jgi:uncharacterized membrane protein YuzA (DUF378 family)